MCDIVFEKATWRGGKVSRTRVYAEAAALRVQGVMKRCYVPQSLS